MKYKYFIGKKLLCETEFRVKFSDLFPAIKEVEVKEAASRKKDESLSPKPAVRKQSSSGDSNSTLKERDKEE